MTFHTRSCLSGDGRSLDLSGKPITFRHFAQLKPEGPYAQVVEVTLNGCEQVGDGQMPNVARFPLTTLNADGTQFGDPALDHVSPLAPTLVTLSLARTKVTAPRLVTALRDFAALRRLDVTGTGITRDELSELTDANTDLELVCD